MLKADFGSLFRILEAMDSQVVGREPQTPPSEVAVQLHRMIKGEPLTDEERLALFEALKKQPGWTAWLAEQIKARRTIFAKGT